jgi:hypothetical protein
MGEILGEIIGGILQLLPKPIGFVLVVVGAIWVFGGFDSSGSGQSSRGRNSRDSTVTAFAAGAADRTTWEKWFSGLSGEFRNGAEYWAGVRSRPLPNGCEAMLGRQSPDFVEGCRVAKTYLDQTDRRLYSEDEYKKGWNSYR